MTERPTIGDGLSTQPPVAPDPTRRTVVSIALLGWRQLTSMRTALVLLFMLALAAVPGSLVPQQGVNPGQVARFEQTHPALTPLFIRLSLFDVFGAPWFAAIYLALFVSLAGCVLPRLWRHLAAVRAAPPPAPRHLSRLGVSARWEDPRPPEEVAADAARVLRRRRFRVVTRSEADGPGERPGGAGALAVAAEKGYLRELGNLIFHAALIVLLVGVALGGMFGYKGSVLVVAGHGFSNTVASYDAFNPGRFFSTSELAPFTVQLDRFHATYQPNGEPATYDAYLSYGIGGAPATHRYDLRVNSPLDIGGTKVYLIAHGYAPEFVVYGADGHRDFAGAVPFLPNNSTFASDGVVKVPDVAPGPGGTPRQLGFSGFFTPTTVFTPTGIGSSFPAPRDPAVTLLAWVGNLGLNNGIPQSVYVLDTAQLKRVTDAQGRPVTQLLRPGQTMTLPGGLGRITFTGYKQFVTLQVTHDPGRIIALIAAICIVSGLILSLFVKRRRVWVRVHREGSRTVVEAGGLARTDSDGFTEEFGRLVPRLRRE